MKHYTRYVALALALLLLNGCGAKGDGEGVDLPTAAPVEADGNPVPPTAAPAGEAGNPVPGITRDAVERAVIVDGNEETALSGEQLEALLDALAAASGRIEALTASDDIATLPGGLCLFLTAGGGDLHLSLYAEEDSGLTLLRYVGTDGDHSYNDTFEAGDDDLYQCVLNLIEA